ncbi:MAG: hypothetical protein FWB97_10585, partial [Oscillospiraceae bacterium]|nr:hypothetical protein [Oscillospiraceae bacterium]
PRQKRRSRQGRPQSPRQKRRSSQGRPQRPRQKRRNRRCRPRSPRRNHRSRQGRRLKDANVLETAHARVGAAAITTTATPKRQRHASAPAPAAHARLMTASVLQAIAAVMWDAADMLAPALATAVLTIAIAAAGLRQHLRLAVTAGAAGMNAVAPYRLPQIARATSK